MKKMTCILAAAFLIAACSKKSGTENPEPEPPQPPDPTEAKALPSKITQHFNNQTAVFELHYVADSKKLDRITGSSGRTDLFTYQGDLITKIQYGEANNDAYTTFEYNGDKLIKETQYRDNKPRSKTEISYPADKQVSVKTFDYENGAWVSDGSLINLELDANGNLIRAQASGGDVGNVEATVIYNDKYAPFINVAGWAKIRLLSAIPLGENVDFEDIFGRQNNPTKTTVLAGGNTVAFQFSYEFKDSGKPNFPTRATADLGNGRVFTAEIQYK